MTSPKTNERPSSTTLEKAGQSAKTEFQLSCAYLGGWNALQESSVFAPHPVTFGAQAGMLYRNNVQS